MDENRINEQLSILEGKIASLQNELFQVKNERKPIAIPIDTITRKSLDSVVLDDMFDGVWNKIFYHQTFFESLDGWNSTNNPSGSTTIFPSDIQLTTAASANATMLLAKSPLVAGILNFTKDSGFRTTIYFASGALSNSVIDFVVGGVGSLNPNYGFQINNGVVYGRTKNSSSTASGSAELMTLSDARGYKLEARFYSGSKVSFFVDGIEKGSLSRILPAGTASTLGIPQVFFKTTNSSAKTINLSNFEFIQIR